jgi:hypothetical protein
MLGLLKEIYGCSTITCDQFRLGIFQQGIVTVFAGSRLDRFDPGI